MKASSIKTTAFFCFAMLALNAYAGQESEAGRMKMEGMHMNGMNMNGMNMEASGMDSSQSMSMNEGEVKAVDRKNKSITLKHGHVKSKTVDMGPMTMSFPVRKESLLKGVKAGDKVKFTVENLNDVMTVTALKVEK